MMLGWLCVSPSFLWAKKQKQPVPVFLSEQDTHFDYYYYAAITAMNNQQYDRALLLLRYCKNKNPQNAAVNAMLGTIYEGMNWAEALPCYEVAVNTDPMNWTYRRHYVEALSKANDQQKAIEIVREEVKQNPKNDDAWNVLSILYKIEKQYTKSIDALNKLEKLVGIDEYISLEKFRMYIQLHKLPKGIAEIDKLIAEFPDNYRYKVFRGDIFMEQQMQDKAFEIYQKVLKEDSENPYVYLSLAEYYKATNAPDKAVKSILEALENKQLDMETKLAIMAQYAETLVSNKENDQAMDSLLKTMLEIYPLEERVHGYYVMHLMENNQLEEAEKTLHTMLDINPKNSKTWSQLLNMAVKKGDQNQILEICLQAIEQIPNNPIWYFYKGVAEYTQQKYEEALQSNIMGLSYTTGQQKELKVRLLGQMGDIYFKMGKERDAYAMYEDALKINPNDLNILNNYAYDLAKNGQDMKKAERMSAKTVETESSNPVYLDTYAWIFYKQGNYSLAKFYIERALDNLTEETQQHDPEIWEHYGYILQKNGAEQQAKEAWEKAVVYGSENEEIKAMIYDEK